MKIKKLLLLFIFPLFILSCGGDDNSGTDPNPGNGNGGGAVDPGENQPLLKTLKIMTYNIHSCIPPSKPNETDLDAIAKVVKDASPDIVFLQEVDKNTGRNGNYDDQASEIAKKTGMKSAYFPARVQGKGFYGVAILSKYEIGKTQLHELPRENNLEQRVLGTAIIKLPGEENIMAAVTHLQHNSETNRLEQIKEVVKNLKDETMPVVLGADFNEKTTATDFFDVFDAAFTRTCIGYECPNTFPATNPSSVIDYLAFKPSSSFDVTLHFTVKEIYASDHLPVISLLTFKRD